MAKIATLFAEFRQTGLTALMANMEVLRGKLIRVNASLSKFSSAAKKAFLITGGVMAFAVREAAKFQTQMAMVATMLDSKMMPIMADFEKGVQSLSAEFGQSTEVLAKGLYDILSASVAPEQALQVLRVAAESAAGGFTTTAVAADALTTVLNSYQISADQAGDVSDKLFATVKRGKLTFAELASGIGKAAATAALAGVSLEELLASIATITRAGIRSDQAMVAVVGTIRAFLKPSLDGAAAAKALGFELSAATLETEGLLGVFQKLRGLDAGQLATIFPNTRGLKGVAAAMQDLAGFGKDVGLMYQSAGRRAEALAKVQATLGFQVQQLRKGFTGFLQTLGKMLLPSIVKLVDWLKTLVKAMTANKEKILSFLKTIAEWSLKIIIVIGAIKLLIITLTLLLNPLALIAVGLVAIIAAFVDWDDIVKALTGSLMNLLEVQKSLTDKTNEMGEAHEKEASELKNKVQLIDQLKRKEDKTIEDNVLLKKTTDDLLKAFPQFTKEIGKLGTKEGDLGGTLSKIADTMDKKLIKKLKEQVPKVKAEIETELVAAADTERFIKSEQKRANETKIPFEASFARMNVRSGKAELKDQMASIKANEELLKSIPKQIEAAEKRIEFRPDAERKVKRAAEMKKLAAQTKKELAEQAKTDQEARDYAQKIQDIKWAKAEEDRIKKKAQVKRRAEATVRDKQQGMQSLLGGIVGGLSSEEQKKFQAGVFKQQITAQLGPDLAKEHAGTIDKIAANMMEAGKTGPSGGRFQSFTDLRKQIQGAALSPEVKLGKMQLEEAKKIHTVLVQMEKNQREAAIMGD